MSNYDGLTESQTLDLMFFHFQRGGLMKDAWLKMRGLAHQFGYCDHALCGGQGLVTR